MAGRKKLHWTQRPENKAKMRRVLRNATKKKQEMIASGEISAKGGWKTNGKKRGKYKRKVTHDVVNLDNLDITVNTKGGSNGGNGKEDTSIAYIFGKTEENLSQYARSSGVPYPTLASRVGKLLQQTAKR